MSIICEENWGFAAERQFAASRKSPAVVTIGGPSLSHFSEGDEETLSAADLSLMRKALNDQSLQSQDADKVEVVRGRGTDPLRAVKSFSQLQLPQPLLDGVFALGFSAPSRIQETALPTLLADPPTNMIAQAQSGTGKTAAFALASLARVRPELAYPQVLILAPTYELALQIGGVAQKMALFCTNITFRFAVREEMLPRGHLITEHVLIGTPGKVFDWSRRRNFFDLQKVSVFVLDEADVMISMQGHHDQCLRIHRMLSSECQTLLFSATYTSEVMRFAEMIVREPIVIRLRREEETLDNVRQFVLHCPSDGAKYAALQNVYGALSIGQAILFCHTRRTASWLGEKMTTDGHSVGYLSGELSLVQRVDALTGFREGKQKVLITTNVCARGIDVQQVTVVVNFDIPVTVDGRADCETYLHRIGRSGRFGRHGVALNMAACDRDLQLLRDIEAHFGRAIAPLDPADPDQLDGINA